MIAIELVKPGTSEPDAALAGQIAKACHAEGLVVLTAGTYGNVLRFLPPLVIGAGPAERRPRHHRQAAIDARTEGS